MPNPSVLNTPNIQATSDSPGEPTLEHPPRLFPEEADHLLRRLIHQRWRRLSSEYDDPLGILFGNRARQWTAGWDTETHALLLLVWETDSWQEKPVWSLYQDGFLVFQEEDGFSQNRSNWFHQLLESEKFPFINHQQFLEPLVDFLFPEPQRHQSCERLLQTILARPEIFIQLKEPLFKALEAELGNPEWPVLEVLKIHRLAHKVPLVDLFRLFVENGLIRAEKDCLRLDNALTRLQTTFSEQGSQISSLFQAMFAKHVAALRQIITHGTWRIKLRPVSAEEATDEPVEVAS